MMSNPSPPSVPNIICIVCHDLGRELGCYGRGLHTPHLAAFAESGIIFDDAVCTSTACSPSRACMMTGLYPHQNGVMGLAHTGWSMPIQTRTIVDYLNADGRYETAHVGLQHERHPDGEGLNRYQTELWTRHSDTFVEHAVQEAVSFLEVRAGRRRPFFLNVGLLETHPQRWGRPYMDGRAERYRPFQPEVPAAVPYFVEPEGGDTLRRFQGAIRYMDHHLGRLFAALNRLGFFENSLIVFTTDHGPALGPKSKGTLYEPGLGIALLVRPPGGGTGGGRVEPGLVQNMDLMPTFLDAAEVAIPAEIEGRSLWRTITDGKDTPHDALFCQRNYHGGRDGSNYYDPLRACRTPDWLYIRNYQKRGDRPREELFDLRTDRICAHNVIAEPRAAAVRRDLSARLDACMRRTDDPLLRGPIRDPLAPSLPAVAPDPESGAPKE